MMRRWLIVLPLTLALICPCILIAQTEIDASREAKFDEELLYLPNEKLLNHFTGGMSSVVADVLWLKCIQYTSKHFRSDRKFTWLDHMCGTITRLDPHFTDVYLYGGIFLAAIKADSDASIELLQKGMVENPDAWELPHEIAMVYLLNRREEPDSPSRAAEYLKMAVDTDNAPQSVINLAQNLAIMHNLTDVERAMWLEMKENSGEKMMRDLAERKLQELTLRESCDVMNKAIEMFREKHGRPPETLQQLVSGGILVAVPTDPLGGKYFLDQEDVAQNTTLLDATVERRLDRIRAGLERFKERTGHWPETLEEAVESDDLSFIPKNPYADREWRYNKLNGAVYSPIHDIP